MPTRYGKSRSTKVKDIPKSNGEGIQTKSISNSAKEDWQLSETLSKGFEKSNEKLLPMWQWLVDKLMVWQW